MKINERIRHWIWFSIPWVILVVAVGMSMIGAHINHVELDERQGWFDDLFEYRRQFEEMNPDLNFPGDGIDG